MSYDIFSVPFLLLLLLLGVVKTDAGNLHIRELLCLGPVFKG